LQALRANLSAKNLSGGADHRSRFRDRSNIHGRRTAIEPRALPRLAPRQFHAHSTELPFSPHAFIFDVEGTLVDNVLATLQCWSETLAEIGYHTGVADLHPFSGMDGKRMLRRLLKRHDSQLLERIVRLQGERYKLHYLQHARPFPKLRRLFTVIKDRGAKIALATSCDRHELAHYRTVMNVDDLIDAACCGEDVRQEKPSPDIVVCAARKLRLLPSEIAMVGDTPCDAEAAHAAGMTAIGLQSGHFSRSDLLDAGCTSVFFDLQSLAQKLESLATTQVDGLDSPTAAAVDSH
jgi:HAD superfamily hydrolase (TIGR01509 family)